MADSGQCGHLCPTYAHALRASSRRSLAATRPRPAARRAPELGGSEHKLMQGVQFPKKWTCPELRIADGTPIGSGVLSLTARARLDLEVTLRDVMSLGGEDLTIIGVTADGEPSTRPCAR